MQQRENIFISYCREDSRWLEMFRTVLAPLLRKEQLKIWDDTKITPGSKWYEEIGKAVASSKVALLLVSPHFLASKFIMEYELPLINAERANGLKVLWVAVSPSMFQFTDLKDDQALNDPGKPLNSFTSAKLDQELMNICWSIKEVMDASSQDSGGII